MPKVVLTDNSEAANRARLILSTLHTLASLFSQVAEVPCPDTLTKNITELDAAMTNKGAVDLDDYDTQLSHYRQILAKALEKSEEKQPVLVRYTEGVKEYLRQLASLVGSPDNELLIQAMPSLNLSAKKATGPEQHLAETVTDQISDVTTLLSTINTFEESCLKRWKHAFSHDAELEVFIGLSRRGRPVAGRFDEVYAKQQAKLDNYLQLPEPRVQLLLSRFSRVRADNPAYQKRYQTFVQKLEELQRRCNAYARDEFDSFANKITERGSIEAQLDELEGRLEALNTPQSELIHLLINNAALHFLAHYSSDNKAPMEWGTSAIKIGNKLHSLRGDGSIDIAEGLESVRDDIAQLNRTVTESFSTTDKKIKKRLVAASKKALEQAKEREKWYVETPETAELLKLFAKLTEEGKLKKGKTIDEGRSSADLIDVTTRLFSEVWFSENNRIRYWATIFPNDGQIQSLKAYSDSGKFIDVAALEGKLTFKAFYLATETRLKQLEQVKVWAIAFSDEPELTEALAHIEQTGIIEEPAFARLKNQYDKKLKLFLKLDKGLVKHYSECMKELELTTAGELFLAKAGIYISDPGFQLPRGAEGEAIEKLLTKLVSDSEKTLLDNLTIAQSRIDEIYQGTTSGKKSKAINFVTSHLRDHATNLVRQKSEKLSQLIGQFNAIKEGDNIAKRVALKAEISACTTFIDRHTSPIRQLNNNLLVSATQFSVFESLLAPVYSMITDDEFTDVNRYNDYSSGLETLLSSYSAQLTAASKRFSPYAEKLITRCRREGQSLYEQGISVNQLITLIKLNQLVDHPSYAKSLKALFQPSETTTLSDNHCKQLISICREIKSTFQLDDSLTEIGLYETEIRTAAFAELIPSKSAQVARLRNENSSLYHSPTDLVLHDQSFGSLSEAFNTACNMPTATLKFIDIRQLLLQHQLVEPQEIEGESFQVYYDISEWFSLLANHISKINEFLESHTPQNPNEKFLLIFLDGIVKLHNIQEQLKLKPQAATAEPATHKKKSGKKKPTKQHVPSAKEGKPKKHKKKHKKKRALPVVLTHEERTQIAAVTHQFYEMNQEMWNRQELSSTAEKHQEIIGNHSILCAQMSAMSTFYSNALMSSDAFDGEIQQKFKAMSQGYLKQFADLKALCQSSYARVITADRYQSALQPDSTSYKDKARVISDLHDEARADIQSAMAAIHDISSMKETHKLLQAKLSKKLDALKALTETSSDYLSFFKQAYSDKEFREHPTLGEISTQLAALQEVSAETNKIEQALQRLQESNPSVTTVNQSVSQFKMLFESVTTQLGIASSIDSQCQALEKEKSPIAEAVQSLRETQLKMNKEQITNKAKELSAYLNLAVGEKGYCLQQQSARLLIETLSWNVQGEFGGFTENKHIFFPESLENDIDFYRTHYYDEELHARHHSTAYVGLRRYFASLAGNDEAIRSYKENYFPDRDDDFDVRGHLLNQLLSNASFSRYGVKADLDTMATRTSTLNALMGALVEKAKTHIRTQIQLHNQSLSRGHNDDCAALSLQITEYFQSEVVTTSPAADSLKQLGTQLLDTVARCNAHEMRDNVRYQDGMVLVGSDHLSYYPDINQEAKDIQDKKRRLQESTTALAVLKGKVSAAYGTEPEEESNSESNKLLRTLQQKVIPEFERVKTSLKGSIGQQCGDDAGYKLVNRTHDLLSSHINDYLLGRADDERFKEQVSTTLVHGINQQSVLPVSKSTQWAITKLFRRFALWVSDALGLNSDLNSTRAMASQHEKDIMSQRNAIKTGFFSPPPEERPEATTPHVDNGQGQDAPHDIDFATSWIDEFNTLK